MISLLPAQTPPEGQTDRRTDGPGARPDASQQGRAAQGGDTRAIPTPRLLSPGSPTQLEEEPAPLLRRRGDTAPADGLSAAPAPVCVSRFAGKALQGLKNEQTKKTTSFFPCKNADFPQSTLLLALWLVVS